jgi:large-conductance mechanosensitive channel
LVLGLISIPAHIIAAVFFAIGSFLGVLAVLFLIVAYILFLIASILLPIKRATITTIPGGTSCRQLSP